MKIAGPALLSRRSSATGRSRILQCRKQCFGWAGGTLLRPSTTEGKPYDGLSCIEPRSPAARRRRATCTSDTLFQVSLATRPALGFVSVRNRHGAGGLRRLHWSDRRHEQAHNGGDRRLHLRLDRGLSAVLLQISLAKTDALGHDMARPEVK